MRIYLGMQVCIRNTPIKNTPFISISRNIKLHERVQFYNFTVLNRLNYQQ